MLEAARVAALASYDILDTPPEPDFDDVVEIARQVCETATALVSLVTADRQWFKARVGFEASETPLDQSVCLHVLAVPDLLVIPDLTQDVRTRDNALVTGAPHIRFYAGAVLRTAEGIAIGSLCVIDGAPRPSGLTPGQAATLVALARQVMAMLALRRAVAARETALVDAHASCIATLARAQVSATVNARMLAEQARQTDALEAGGIGTFEIDVASYQARVSAQTCRIFGLPVAASYAVEDLQAPILASDRHRAVTRQTIADGTMARASDFRVRRPSDGALRWIARHADFRTDASGGIVAMVGIVRDITERKQVDLLGKALLDLGDALRDATTVADTVDRAARTLGETLGGSRAALSLLDLAAGTIRVERDWRAPGVAKIAGTYPVAGYRATIERLKEDAPIVNANIPADLWLAADAAGYARIGVKAQIVVPLLERGRLVAALFIHNAAPRTWGRGEIDFVVAVADRTQATLAKIRAEDHQKILNEELSHRLKNTLSMVQAITAQTLRGVADREVVRALDERIIALSKAHEVLLQQSFVSAAFDAVVARVMSLHGHEGRIAQAGPAMILGPKATLSLTMLLHEMATNAIKYGALSVEAGHVDIAWRLVEDDDEPALVLEWTERGGPPAQPPTRRGFGSRLIGLGLMGTGNATLAYGPEGLRGRFLAPLRAIEEN